MTTAAEYAVIAALEANLAATAAVDVQNKVAIAESSANLATTHAATVGSSVAGAETSNVAAGVKAIESGNFRDLAKLWANGDPNVIVEDDFYSARHHALLTLGMLAVMQSELDAHTSLYNDNKTATDASTNYLAFRLDTGLLAFDSTTIDQTIVDLENSLTAQVSDRLTTALYDANALNLADFAKSNDIATSNKIVDYLDEAGQIALQAMLTGASNQTKLSYAGVVVSPETGNITSAAGSALATEYGLRVAAIEETIGSSSQPGLGTMQAKYTIKTDVNGHVAGFGLINTANTDNSSTGFSEFIISADSFKVGATGSTSAPFRVVTNGGVTGGGVCITNTGTESGGVLEATCIATSGNKWLAPGVYTKSAMIDHLVVNTADISGLLTIGGKVNDSLINLQPAYDDATTKSNASTTAAANALTAFSNTVYYPGTTEIDGANIRTGSITLFPQDVGAGVSGSTSGNRLVITSTTISVYDANNTLRVKIGNLS